MSPEVRSHAVRNERLPLRTVVQVLFFEQEKSSTTTDRKYTSPVRDDLSKLKLSAEEQSSEAKSTRPSAPGTSGVHQYLREFDDKQQLGPEPSFKIRPEMEKGREITGDGKAQLRRVSEKTYSKGRER